MHTLECPVTYPQLGYRITNSRERIGIIVYSAGSLSFSMRNGSYFQVLFSESWIGGLLLVSNLVILSLLLLTDLGYRNPVS